MPRMVDAHCANCNVTSEDFFVDPDEFIPCATCGQLMEQIWWTRVKKHAAEWSDKDSVVVFRKANGDYEYPAVNTKPTPKGCERIVMRSLRAVERFENEAGVKNEAMHFDRNGRGFDDQFRGKVYRD